MSGSERDRPVRVGVFGGSFDPPHAGHRAVVLAALDHVDHVVVVPCADGAHKGRELATAAWRVEATRMLFASDEQVTVSGCDVDAGPPTFTVDTLRRVRERVSVPVDVDGKVEWWLVVGEDAWEDLANWHRPGRIHEMTAGVLVAPRPGNGQRGGCRGGGWLTEDSSGVAVVVLDGSVPQVSSSCIRSGVRTGRAHWAVPVEVLACWRHGPGRSLAPTGQ